MAKGHSKVWVERLRKKINAQLVEAQRASSEGRIVFKSSKLSTTSLSPLNVVNLNLAYRQFVDEPFSSVPPQFVTLLFNGIKVPKPYLIIKVRSRSSPKYDRKTISAAIRQNYLMNPSRYNYNYPEYFDPNYVIPLRGPAVFGKKYPSSISSWYGSEFAVEEFIISADIDNLRSGEFVDPKWFTPTVMSAWMTRLETDFGYPEFVDQATNPWMRPSRLDSYFSLRSFSPNGTFECTDIYDQILTQYNGHTANVGMTLGESRETLNYLRDRLSSLLDLVLNAKKGKPLLTEKKLLRLRLKHKVDSLTSAQLEYQYAILPLMQDIENYISLYHRKIMPKCKGFKRYKSSFDIPVPTLSNPKFHDFSGPNPYDSETVEEFAVTASTPSYSGSAWVSDSKNVFGRIPLTQHNSALFKSLNQSSGYPHEQDKFCWAQEYPNFTPSTTVTVTDGGSLANFRVTDFLSKSLIFYPSKPLDLTSSIGLSGKDLPSLLWDLKSLSFVYNWFINVDEVISGYMDKAGDLEGVWVESYKLDREVAFLNSPSVVVYRTSAFNRQVQVKSSVQGWITLSTPSSWSQLVSMFSLMWKRLT